jgi:hypothetical protein
MMHFGGVFRRYVVDLGQEMQFCVDTAHMKRRVRCKRTRVREPEPEPEPEPELGGEATQPSNGSPLYIYDRLDQKRRELIEQKSQDIYAAFSTANNARVDAVRKEIAQGVIECGQTRLPEIVQVLYSQVREEFEEYVDVKAQEFKSRIEDAEEILALMSNALSREVSGGLTRTSSNAVAFKSVIPHTPAVAKSLRLSLLAQVAAVTVGSALVAGAPILAFGVLSAGFLSLLGPLRAIKKEIIGTPEQQIEKMQRLTLADMEVRTLEYLFAWVQKAILTEDKLKLIDLNIKERARAVLNKMQERLRQNRAKLGDLTETRANTDEDMQNMEGELRTLQHLRSKSIQLHDEYLISKRRDEEIVVGMDSDLNELDITGLRARAREQGLKEEDIDAACKESELLTGVEDPEETKQNLIGLITKHVKNRHVRNVARLAKLEAMTASDLQDLARKMNVDLQDLDDAVGKTDKKLALLDLILSTRPPIGKTVQSGDGIALGVRPQVVSVECATGNVTVDLPGQHRAHLGDRGALQENQVCVKALPRSVQNEELYGEVEQMTSPDSGTESDIEVGGSQLQIAIQDSASVTQGTVLEMLPHGSKFDSAVTVRVDMSEQIKAAGEGSVVMVLRKESADASWLPMDGPNSATVDEHGMVTLSLHEFSLWNIIAVPFR